MDGMTDEEFEYEFLQDMAYKEIANEILNNQQIQMNNENQSFNREFKMDDDEYDHIIELADKGEYIDFEIPNDAPEGKKMSEKLLGIENLGENDDLIPVDPLEILKRPSP